jgi:hypothetical protein
MGGSASGRRGDQHQQTEGKSKAGSGQLAQGMEIVIHGENGEGVMTLDFG